MKLLVPFTDLSWLPVTQHLLDSSAILGQTSSGEFIGGPAVEKFEKDFADYCGSNQAVGVGNGLDALRLSLIALGIGTGDEVIVPGFSFVATWYAVAQTGATCVPVDVKIEDATIDPSLIPAAISGRTKAILAVHLYGNIFDANAIRQIADDHDLFLIEDAAQAHGARYQNHRVGAIGDIAAFSFYPTKNLGALGDGGAITTNDSRLAEKVRSLASYGWGAERHDHKYLGWNSRLDSIQAAVLRLRLRRLDKHNARRAAIGETIKNLLIDKGFGVVGANSPGRVWHLLVAHGTQVELLREWLQAEGIQTSCHYPYTIQEIEPLQAGNYVRAAGTLENSEYLSSHSVSLPLHQNMPRAVKQAILKAIRRFPQPSVL